MDSTTRLKYTNDFCRDEALKCKTIREFKKKSPRVYEAARIRGLLDDICKHMDKPISKSEFWAKKENCLKEALKFDSRSRFNSDSSYAYNSCRANNWLEEACRHMKSTKELSSKPRKWEKNNVFKEAKKYKSRVEFQKESSGAYSAAQKNKWLDAACSHMKKRMGFQFGKKKYWNKENCKKEALKYKSRKAFSIGSSGAYSVSRRNNWLEEICTHMKR